MSDSFKNIDRITEDLAENSMEPKNWKGILIALLVISSICTVISLTIFLLSPHFGLQTKTERLKLEQIISENFNFKPYNLSWISSYELTYFDPDGNLVIYDIESKWKTNLISNTSLKSIKVERYLVSHDRQYVLLVHDIKKIHSYSYKARYKIYNVVNKTISSLKASDSGVDTDLLQYAEWGPRSSQLIVLNNNKIFYYPKYDDKSILITTSNENEFLSNGAPDLMYEEFILKSNKAFWWNSDGSKLCFASFDNSFVNHLPLVIYGSHTNFTEEKYSFDPSIDLIYPKVIKYPFPKPGKSNPFVTLLIVDVDTLSASPKKVTIPDQLKHLEYYINAVNWIGFNKLSVIWSKRSQNYTIVSICEERKDWKCEMLLEERLSSSYGWLDINQTPLFSKDNLYYFMKLPVADGSLGTFSHVVMFTVNENKKYHLTHGQYVVTKILAHRSDIHKVFYIATITGEPRVRHLFSVTDIEDENPRIEKCLSCHIPDCSYFDAFFSSNDHYFILQCLGPGIPRTELRLVKTNQLVEILNTFPKLKEQLGSIALPRTEYLSISLDEENFARIRILLPPELDEEDTLKYPLVIKINSEPEKQSVNNLNYLTWEHYLASKKEYVVANIDVRGSNYQGDKYKHSIYHHLAEYEALDIIQVAKFLKNHLTYIDEDKIAIWGTEIGGYLVISLMIRDPIFNCGIAVSPVTNWRNYASFPIERYMGSPWPKENFIYYDKSDLFRNLNLIKDKEFMIIHGTADYKVNIQHSMLLIKALTDLAIPFRIQIYPDADHSFTNYKLHFAKTMEDFFSKCFQLEDEEDQLELPITRVIKGSKRIISGED